MPTGYTAGVGNGDVTEFPEFAMQCARAFGALVMLRDMPSGAEIPERFEPSDYHLKIKAQAEADLKRLNAMTDEQIMAARDVAEAKRLADRANHDDAKADQKDRYEAMLTQVEQWVPPTADHAEMKNFMRDQLAESIKFDCSPSTWNAQPLPPAMEWHKGRVEQAQKDIAYHAKAQAEEVERTEGRNKWLADLRSSLNK